MTQTRAEKFAVFFRLLRISSGFFLALFILLLWGRLELIDVLLISLAGASVCWFLLSNDQQIIRALRQYFRHKASSNSPAEATPTSNLMFSANHVNIRHIRTSLAGVKCRKAGQLFL